MVSSLESYHNIEADTVVTELITYHETNLVKVTKKCCSSIAQSSSQSLLVLVVISIYFYLRPTSDVKSVDFFLA